ncbi:MAG: RNA polymerase sigma factor [Acidimicrobiia bacterium]
MGESDQELLEGCRRGDPRAWRGLLDRYERLVYSIPLSYGLARTDAADVAQTTFTILVKSLDSLREDTRLAPWLATVARRHTWRALERSCRESVNAGEDLAEALAVLQGRDSDAAERWEMVSWVHEALGRLEGRCRELLTLLYFDPEEPTYEEVGRRLGMPVGSIGPTRARCLERLRRDLRE